MILQIGKNKTEEKNNHFFSILNLKGDPFGVTPDPDFYYPSTIHQKCLAMLEIGIRQKRGLHVIIGDIGTGKTTLSRCLLRNLQKDSKHKVAIILNPSFNLEEEFYTELASVFDLPCTTPSLRVFKELKEFLMNSYINQKKTITLIIDEAQKLTLNTIEILRILLNFETNNDKLIQLILFGQNELYEKLVKMPNFIERVNYKYKLTPIKKDEMIKLIKYRIYKVSLIKDNNIFSKKAYDIIYDFSKGIPRRACLFAHKALEKLIIKQRKKADERIMDEIIKEENSFYECLS